MWAVHVRLGRIWRVAERRRGPSFPAAEERSGNVGDGEGGAAALYVGKRAPKSKAVGCEGPERSGWENVKRFGIYDLCEKSTSGRRLV